MEILGQTHRSKSHFSISPAGLRQQPSFVLASSRNKDSAVRIPLTLSLFLKTDVESLSVEKHKLPCRLFQG